MSDFRLPPVPGVHALPKWRQNPAFNDIGLSADSIALLDASEVEERAMAARLRERTAANRAVFEGAHAAILGYRLEQQRTGALSIGELREELADAIDSVNMEQPKVGDAEAILQRANTSVAEAQQRLAQYADLDQRIAAFHTNRIRNGTNAALPPDLVDARREQRDAVENLTATQTVFVDLAAEVQAAQSRLEQAAQERDKAAVAVVSRHCDGLAVQVDQTLQRLHDLRGQLLSISSLWISLANVTSALPISDHVRAALRRGEERPLVSEDVKSAARDYFVRLQTDAKATF